MTPEERATAAVRVHEEHLDTVVVEGVHGEVWFRPDGGEPVAGMLVDALRAALSTVIAEAEEAAYARGQAEMRSALAGMLHQRGYHDLGDVAQGEDGAPRGQR
jgi:uncharacterized protein (DUF58 family)